MVDATKPREQRWEEEARFFDDWARKIEVKPIPDITLARYSSARDRYNKEFRFHLLGDLRGKRVLDFGCGDGLNSALLAKLGANVVGVDISPEAIEVARRRARVNGVEDRVDFRCSPIETVDLEPDSFDIVWGDGILHHLTSELPLVMSKAASWARPGGTMLFSEPLNLFPTMRTIRLKLPIPVNGTPNERPLEEGDLDQIRPFYEELHVRHFGILGRLDAFILENMNYERSSAARRAVVDRLAAVDSLLLKVPALRRLCSTAVLHGTPRKSR